MSPLNHCFAMPHRQRGAIGLVAALTLGLALLFTVTVLDSGRLYLEKRSLQRIADMAALEAASRKGNCSSAATASLYATQSATRNGFIPDTDGRTLNTLCGTLSVNAADGRRAFVANAASTDAIRVVASHGVPRSIAAGVAALFSSGPQSANVQLSATAVAAATPPLAQLSIRNVLATASLPILNSIAKTNIDLLGWQGLANINLNLLSYLDRLKTDLNLTAVGYTQVLSANATVSQLIQTAINVLQTNGTLSTSATILNLQALKAAAGSTTVVLGDLIKVQGGTDLAGLNSTVNVFDLISSLTQMANKKNGITANSQINVLGIGQITTQLKVIEPPQLSAIGDPRKVNPALAVADDPNRIYVRTAQTRMLVSVNLPLLDILNKPPVNAVTKLVGNLTSVLNNALTLNIAGVVGDVTCLLGAKCLVTDPWILPSSSSSLLGPRIDLSLSLAGGEAYVTGYTCNSNTDKSLSVRTNASLLNARLGLIDSAAAFPASTDPAAVIAQPLPIVDIGTQTCTQLLNLLGSCTARVPFAGGGIGMSFNTLNNALLTSPASVNTTINMPAEIGQPPTRLPAAAYVKSSTLLDGVVSGVNINVYKPLNGNALGSLISGTGTLLNTLLGLVDQQVELLLKPLLTSVLDPLLDTLGLTLNPTDVGANLSCNFGQATLVI
ncbi:pilus assembly protein TadG-related protein [Pseudomonas sp. 21LCFQ02]|uniref:pilus assembly protein TadG-related protein n=1 Tax=Pseudomonas sp. 21LCFQ02 TaxID=2957505 RepID=UPI00209AD65F|nr:pilus assembly protein TadG-related protein [Pseudomonas sp. 21LCFQ02]MCO8169825.1 pilus assembly protein TadG-related protein [Pseudomonas sp. 21LCFQ02]